MTTTTTTTIESKPERPPYRCPKDGGALAERDGALHCDAGHRFPVDAEIPRFVPDSTYTDHFGLQWNTYPRTQFDSYTGVPITRNRIRRALGEALWDGLASLQVLECGCGAGRFTEILLDRGANVTSVDLSNAVDANAKNFPPSDRHRIAQADITALPFAEQSFDVVFCLGVVQHTPDPAATIAALYRYVKPGGWLVIDHYTHTLRWYTTAAPLVRQVLRRMEPARALRVTQRLVDIFLPLHRRFMHRRIARALLSRISPVQCYFNELPELNDRLQREWALLDTHDSLTDWYKHLRSLGWVRRQLEGLGLDAIVCERGGNGIEARGRRPWK